MQSSHEDGLQKVVTSGGASFYSFAQQQQQ